MILALRIASSLALAVWLGAMLFFAMGVAPVAFAVLPDRVIAGTLVNGAMARLHLLGYGAGLIAVVALGARAWLEGGKLPLVKAGLAVAILTLTLASGLAVSPPLAEIRARVGAIDRLPIDDPDRRQFDWLHQLSVSLMGANMLLAAVAIGLDQKRTG